MFTMTPLTLFASYSYISSGMATTVHFIYPVFVFILCFLFFKERINREKWIGLILCLLGITMFFTSSCRAHLMGIILALTSGLSYALYMIYYDKSGLREVEPFKVTLYLSIISSGIMFIYNIYMGSMVVNVGINIWFLITVFSILVSICAVVLFQNGIKEIGTQKSAILGTFEPITSIIIGIIFFHEAI